MKSLRIRLTTLLATSLLAGGLCASVSHAAPILEGGELVGATNVDVDGVLYNVEFLDGSCIGLFSGCDSLGDFDFPNEASAQAAAQALLDQVFLDGLDGAFDSEPALTRGCLAASECSPLIPYAFGGDGVSLLAAVNRDPSQADFTQFTSLPTSFDAVGNSFFTYAVFTPVPEPGTALLLGGGLALLSAHRKARSTK